MHRYILSAQAQQILAEYWYMVLAGLIVAVLLFVAGIILLAKATKQLKENANVTRGRRLEAEENKRKEEERARLLSESVALGVEDVLLGDGEEGLFDEGEADTPLVLEDETVLSAETVIGEKREIKAVYRVIYDRENKEWTVKKDGAMRVIRRVKTKVEALGLARQFAGNQELSVTVQKRDGKFQKKSNYERMLSSAKKE